MQKIITQADIKYFTKDKKMHENFGFLKPEDMHYKIMDIVSNTLKEEKFNIKSKNIDFEEAVISAIDSFKIFNKNYIRQLMKITYMMHEELSENDYRTVISYKYSKKGIIRKHTGKVYNIKIPEKTTEISPIWIGHEYVHALKDTNYNEYIYKDILSEALTIFYEIISAKQNYNNVYSLWKYNRTKTLLYDKKYYEEAKNNLNKDGNSDIYEYIMYSYGQYLTSYYYALNLFHIYNDNPKILIEYINKVLTHKKTTFDLLNEFDIYKINQEHVNIYKLEHSKL